MQNQSSKEKIDLDAKSARTPSSPAKVLGSPVPWHGRQASPARVSTLDKEEAHPGNKGATFESQRPQIGARKWTLSPLNHARSLDTPIQSSEYAPNNSSRTYSFPPNSRSLLSSSSTSTSSSLGYSEVSDNDMRNFSNTFGTSSDSPQLSPISIGKLWEEAIASQEIESVQQLLKCGFDVCGDGAELHRPPLILAVLTGNSALVKLLLTAGADIDCVDSDGLTALHHSAATGDRNLVKLLLVTGADLYGRTKQGLFPMHLATDGPTYQLLSQRFKSDMENPTHSWMDLPREPSSGTIVQLEFPRKNIQTQENVPSTSNETPATFDSSAQGPNRGLAFFRRGSFDHSDPDNGLTNDFSVESLKTSVPSSSISASPNQDADAKLAKSAEKKDFAPGFNDKDALDKQWQFFGTQKEWLQNLLDKANGQDAAKAATLRSPKLNSSEGVCDDGKNVTDTSMEGKSQGSLPVNSTSALASGKIESQQVNWQTDSKHPDKSVKERWTGFGPMLDELFKSQEESVCTIKASQRTNDFATTADNNLIGGNESQQIIPSKNNPELFSSATDSFDTMPGPLVESKVKPSIPPCDNDPGIPTQQQKQKTEDGCVLPENKEASKDSDHNVGIALSSTVPSKEEENSKLQEDPKNEDALQVLSANHDDSQMQGKDKKQVKFVAPSEADLALVRKDWHNAARAGCVGCGAEGCVGKCLPTYADQEKLSDTPSSSKSKKNFKKAQMKKTKNFEWKRGELLGEGAYGKVFCGLNQSTGELMAVKQLKFHTMNDDEENSFYMSCLEREISLYKDMRHKHIVGYIDMDKDEDAGYLYIFLEYVSGGSIQSMLERFGPFSEPLVRVYTRQLLLGLEYLHMNRIVHRDIKGGNVLVDSDGVVKLADFGASKAFHEATVTDACKSIRGSIFWMAPEVIKGENYGRHADIWSVGCTVIEMLTAMHPWPGIDNSWAAIFQIAKASSGPPLPESVSDDGKDFLTKCFYLNPKMRPSASQLLEHPFAAKAPELDQKVAF